VSPYRTTVIITRFQQLVRYQFIKCSSCEKSANLHDYRRERPLNNAVWY